MVDTAYVDARVALAEAQRDAREAREEVAHWKSQYEQAAAQARQQAQTAQAAQGREGHQTIVEMERCPTHGGQVDQQVRDYLKRHYPPLHEAAFGKGLPIPSKDDFRAAQGRCRNCGGTRATHKSIVDIPRGRSLRCADPQGRELGTSWR